MVNLPTEGEGSQKLVKSCLRCLWIPPKERNPPSFCPPRFSPTQNNKYLGTESDQANLYYTTSQKGDHLRSAIGISHLKRVNF